MSHGAIWFSNISKCSSRRGSSSASKLLGKTESADIWHMQSKTRSTHRLDEERPSSRSPPPISLRRSRKACSLRRKWRQLGDARRRSRRFWWSSRWVNRSLLAELGWCRPKPWSLHEWAGIFLCGVCVYKYLRRVLARPNAIGDFCNLAWSSLFCYMEFFYMYVEFRLQECHVTLKIEFDLFISRKQRRNVYVYVLFIN